MTDWTDADVELVARALAAEDVHWGYDHGFGMSIADGKPSEETAAFARAVLSALAAAGRLLPPGGDELHTRVHNAITRTLYECDQWVPLSVRRQLTRAIMAEIAEEGRTDDR